MVVARPCRVLENTESYHRSPSASTGQKIVCIATRVRGRASRRRSTPSILLNNADPANLSGFSSPSNPVISIVMTDGT